MFHQTELAQSLQQGKPKTKPGPTWGPGKMSQGGARQLQPLVPPQVLHFMQVPLRTSV
jgi:hypothetical protein